MSTVVTGEQYSPSSAFNYSKPTQIVVDSDDLVSSEASSDNESVHSESAHAERP